MPQTILVIEDDQFLVNLISKKIVVEGFNVSIALDGKEGLAKAKEEKPDLILLDLLLPGMEGFEVLEKVKEDPEIFATPVIIFSNLDQRDQIERAMKLGAKDYLIKAQFTPDEIIEKVKKALKEK
jgi:DNA-binding response OmpR family regulator